MGGRAIWQALCLILLCTRPLYAQAPPPIPLATPPPPHQPAQTPIIITPGFRTASLAGHLAVLRNPAGDLSFARMAFGTHHPPFKPLSGFLGLGYTNDCIWIRLRVQVPTSSNIELFLDLGPSTLDRVALYVPRRAHPASEADYRQIEIGTHVPVLQRPVFGVTLAAPIMLPGATTSTIYMRLRSTNSVALRGSLESPASMVSNTTTASIRYGIYQGIFLLTFLINFSYWLLIRDKVYLYYALYLSTISLLYYSLNGLLPDWSVLRGLNGEDLIMEITVCLGLVTGALFSSAQMEAEQNFPAMHRALLAAMAAGGLAIPLTLLGYYRDIIGVGYVIGIVVSLLGLGGNFILARRGNPGSLLATFAAASTLIGLAVTTARLNGYLPPSIFTDYAYETGALVYMVQMSIALALRTRNAEQGRQEAQARALRVARDAEEKAEKLVHQRTRELELARRQAEDALRAERDAQKEQLRFIDVISHQYRTPLSVVSSSVSAIALSLSAADQVNQERIARIRRAIIRLVQIIDVTLHRGRLEGAAAQPILWPAPIAPALRAMIGPLQDMFPDHPITLAIAPEDEARVVAFDADLLELAIVNLVENACKFSSPPLPVRITCLMADNTLEIAVSDQGIGIPDTELPLLAQKFFRASNSAHTIGMGLGLHIVTTIARAHGGRIAIQSHENVGTTISLIVPLQDAGAGQK